MNDAVLEHNDGDREEQSAVLREECAVSHAYHSVAGMHCQVVAGEHVHGVYEYIRGHRTLRVLHADEPAFEGEKHHRRGRCPYTHEEVLTRDRGGFGGARHDGQYGGDKEPLDGPHKEGRQAGQTQALHQDLAAFVFSSCAVRLGREARSADTQESEVPIE